MKFPSHLNCDGKIVSEMGPWPVSPRHVFGVICPRDPLYWYRLAKIRTWVNKLIHNLIRDVILINGPLTRYVKLRVAHAPGMPGTFPPPPLVSDPDMHHGTCVTHVPWCMSGSLTSGFLWSRWRGKRSRHSRRMRNTQFCVSGKRPMSWLKQRF